MKAIRTEILDHVGIISFSRPEKYNALSDSMIAENEQALDALIADAEVRCILLRAEGKSFCAGRDTRELGQRAEAQGATDFLTYLQGLQIKQLEAGKPVIAAIQGHAIGIGLEIALAADIRYCASDAQLSLPEILYGILPDVGGMQFLTALIGPARTKFMAMTGRRVDARTALAWGLVDFICEPEQLQAESFALARDIAAKPPLALAMAKRIINQFDEERVRNGLREELLAQTELFKTQDYAEARAAIREKRIPQYKGC